MTTSSSSISSSSSSLVQDGETPYLTDDLRRGLIAMSVVSMFSLILTTTLFVYISYKLIHWKIWRCKERRRHQFGQNGCTSNTTTAPQNRLSLSAAAAAKTLSMDLSLGLSPTHIRNLKRKSLNFLHLGDEMENTDPNNNKNPLAPPPQQEEQQLFQEKSNPILILIYNLLWADVQMSMSFALSLTWLGEGSISRRNSTCWAQGWLLTAGLLAVSCFLIVISFMAYMAVVHKKPQLTRRSLYLSVGAVWTFSYTLGWIGVVITKNGGDGEGWFVSVGAWCWINPQYTMLRIWLEYLWIFLSVLITIALYSIIVLSAYRKGRLLDEISPIPADDDDKKDLNNNNPSSLSLPFSSSSPSSAAAASAQRQPFAADPTATTTSLKTSGHHPAFMIYPVIYILCTAPLTFGRVAEFLGHSPSIEFWSFAGVLAASHGWMNVILWSTIVLVIGPSEAKRTGLDRFAFSLRTPKGRRFGNIVWVEGGGGGKSSSQEELRHGGSKLGDVGIQMEVITTVVVEEEEEEDEMEDMGGPSARLGTAHSSVKDF